MRAPLNAVQLAWLAELGVDAQWLSTFAPPKSPPSAASAQSIPPTPAIAASAPSAPASPTPAASPPRVREDMPGDLAALHQRILDCQQCDLHIHRTRAVPGAGRMQSPEYLIVGEMPGVADDTSGEPFDGQAGVLLRAMLAGAHLPQADSAYLTNVLKCRPPGGRAAKVAEVAACLPYLHQQIELLRPRHIVALGRIAAQALLATRTSLDELRQQRQSYALRDGTVIPVWVTHHPASLLLRPAHKAQAWRDLLALSRANS